MVFHPLFAAGIPGDFVGEDMKAGLQFGDTLPDAFAVLFEQLAPFGLGRRAAVPERRIAQHLADRHPRRFEPAEKFNPNQNRCVVVALPRLISNGVRKEPDPLVVADGVGCQTRTLRELSNLHAPLVRGDKGDKRRIARR